MIREGDVIERILIRQVNWLGDLVMTLPATYAVRERFPRAQLVLLVKSELAGFYDGADWVDEVWPYRVAAGVAGIADRWRLVQRIRRHSFSTAVIFPRSFSSALLIALAGVPRRIGYVADGRGWLLTERYRRDAVLLQKHQLHDHLDLVARSFGTAAADPRPVLPVAAAHAHSMREWLAGARRRAGRLVALAAAAAYGPAKEWPAEYYSALIDWLAERHGIESVLVGAPAEQARCVAIAASSRSGALVAAGRTSVGELIALLSLCDGFAGNDSGAMHVAAALGLPTVGIFGSTRASRTGPIGPHARVIQHPIDCSPCMQRHCRFGHYDCLRSIRVDEVAAALAAAIDSPGTV